jgi:hypothetical protein
MTQTREDELLRVAAPLLVPALLTPNERLALLVQLRDECDQHVTAGVVAARRHHVSWALLGKALGMKPTTAHKRYRDVAPAERDRTVKP